MSPEQSQLDVHLEEIVQKTDEPELANQANENNANEKQSKETEYVKDLREMACETLGKPQNENQRKQPSCKKEKKEWLKHTCLPQKGEKEYEIKKTKFDLRKQELEL